MRFLGNSVIWIDAVDLNSFLERNNKNDVMKTYKETLMKSGIEQACVKLDLNFYEVFLQSIVDSETKQYEGYSWEAIYNSTTGLKEAIVIHAAPPLPKINDYPWEEWYVLDGQAHHAILYTKKKKKNDGEVIIKNNDKEHPESVKGKKWYFFFEKDLRPLLLKNKL